MQNPRVVSLRESVGHACQQFYDLPPRALLGFRPILQRAAVHVFGDKVLPAFDLTYIVYRQNVRMIERRRRLCFALKPAASGSVT